MNLHKRNEVFTVVATVLVLLVAGCTRPAEPAAAKQSSSALVTEISDLDVTTGAKTALLRDDALKAFDIVVVTTKGDVRLTGQVDTQAQFDSAMRIARAVPGAHTIHDELSIKK